MSIKPLDQRIDALVNTEQTLVQNKIPEINEQNVSVPSQQLYRRTYS